MHESDPDRSDQRQKAIEALLEAGCELKKGPDGRGWYSDNVLLTDCENDPVYALSILNGQDC